MDKEEIIERAQKMSSLEDLASLLHSLKQEEYGDNARPITKEKIEYYLQLDNSRRYRQFFIPKKKKGEKRCISAPIDGLSDILHFINRILQAMYLPKDGVTGFIANKSVVDNAKIHLNQNYIFNIDLEDFFTSITRDQVSLILQNGTYRLKDDIASTIADLCCIQHINSLHEKSFVLPQGAPTSPVLTNMVCEELDNNLMNLSRKYQVNYSRYADDISFSSMQNVFQDGEAFWIELKNIIEDNSLKINQNKVHLQKKGERQVVTGLNVTSKVNVSRKYVKQIRLLLHIWRKYGYTSAQKYLYPRYKSDKPCKKGEPLIENVISGKLMYMKMVKGESDPTYRNLKQRFDSLMVVPGLKNRGQQDKCNLTYFVTYNVSEFERTFNTQLYLSEVIPSWNGGAHAPIMSRNEVFNTSIIISSKKLKQIFPPVANLLSTKSSNYLNDNKISVDTLKTLETSDEQLIKIRKNIISLLRRKAKKLISSFKETKNNLFITLCGGSYKGIVSRFWLITDQKPKRVLSDAKEFTIDRLLDDWETHGLSSTASIYNDKVACFANYKVPDIPCEQVITNIDELLDLWEKDNLEEAAESFFQQQESNKN